MIDLHVHSTASDGSFTPAEIAGKGRDFSVMALTDHDCLDGVRPFLEACARLGVRGRRLAGVEISIDPGEGFGKFHLLGYGIDPEHEGLQRFLAHLRDDREARNEEMIRLINAGGIPLRREDLLPFSGGGVIARPHFARFFVARGLAVSVKDAFARLVGEGCPFYAERPDPSQQDALDAIHAAGGVAVMAHPRYWTSDESKLYAGLARLKEMGLDGVEALYQANTPEENVMYLRATLKLGLVPTAGSDFHGFNKPDVPLGMSVAREEEFLAPLFARLDGK